MDWRKKIALVVVVIGIGLGVALQFRKNSSSTESDAASHAVAELSPAASPAFGTTSQNSAQAPAAAADNAVDAAAPSSPAADDSVAPPTSKSTMVDLNAPQQTHKVVDGDTLPKLAQQYLGRTDRAMDIFDYNRDVLRSPDVLPIGAELRIPSRLALPSGGTVATTNPVASATPPKTAAAAAPMVPLVQPAAQPASSQKASPRTYTVQAGDNLIDIARKFYGDGRRNTDLYEANRRTMRNPGDLKAGMVLVVP